MTMSGVIIQNVMSDLQKNYEAHKKKQGKNHSVKIKSKHQKQTKVIQILESLDRKI